jgi:N-acylneuraminate cytidylyltransferase
LGPHQVAYVGNDRNDLECMRWVGLPIAVADAVNDVREAARLVVSRSGGQGAVREVCDLIVQTRGGIHAQASHGR